MDLKSYSRDDFIADMIKELSYLTTEESSNTRNLYRVTNSDIEIYRKLCYDYPIINNDELYRLYQSMHQEMIHNSSTVELSQPVISSFMDSLILTDTFMNNIGYICNNSNLSGSETSPTVLVDHSDIILSKYKLAMLIYFQLPYYILHIRGNHLCKIFNIETVDEFNWYAVLQKYWDVVQASSISVLSVSGLNSKDFQDCFPYLKSLATCITILGNFIVTSENDPLVMEVTEDHENIQNVTLPIQSNNIVILLSELLSTKSNKILQSNVLKLVKKCWLHMVFLYRDLLTQFPDILFPSHLPPFLNSILCINDHSQQQQVSLSSTPVKMISSTTCLFVMTLSNLATSQFQMNNSSSNTMQLGALYNQQALQSISNYLAGEASSYSITCSTLLGLYVEVCNQMHTSGNDNTIPYETISLLLDVGTVFIHHSNNHKYLGNIQQYLAVNRSGKSTLDLMFTSRLLPSLVVYFFKLLKQQQRNQQIITEKASIRSGELQNHVSSRLVGFLSLAILSHKSFGDYLINFSDNLFNEIRISIENIHQQLLSDISANAVGRDNASNSISPCCLLGFVVSLYLYSSVAVTSTSINNINNDAMDSLADICESVLSCICAELNFVFVAFQSSIPQGPDTTAAAVVEEDEDEENIEDQQIDSSKKLFAYYYNSAQSLITTLNISLEIISSESAGVLINTLYHQVVSMNKSEEVSKYPKAAIVLKSFESLNHMIKRLLNLMNEYILTLQTIIATAAMTPKMFLNMDRIENFLKIIQKTKKYLKKMQDLFQGSISNKSD